MLVVRRQLGARGAKCGTRDRHCICHICPAKAIVRESNGTVTNGVHSVIHQDVRQDRSQHLPDHIKIISRVIHRVSEYVPGVVSSESRVAELRRAESGQHRVLSTHTKHTPIEIHLRDGGAMARARDFHVACTAASLYCQVLWTRRYGLEPPGERQECFLFELALRNGARAPD